MSVLKPAFLLRASDRTGAAATVVTATSANAAFPVANLKTVRAVETWRSVSGILVNVDVLYDLGSPQTVNVVALVNHNLSSAATIGIAAGPTAAVASFSATMAWRKYDAFKYITPAQSFQFWRLRLSDAGNAENFLEAGLCPIGNASELGILNSFAPDYRVIDIYDNLDLLSEFGVSNVDTRSYTVQFILRFDRKTDAEAAILRAFFRDSQRNVSPFTFVPDVNGSDVHYCRFHEPPLDRTIGAGQSFTFELIEESRGKNI